MRKFLLSAVALMVSIFMMAAGTGDGTSKANAIDFDWASGHEHVGTKWYRVDLSAIDGMVDPTLALYLTNLSDVPTKVSMNGTATVSISFAGFNYTKDTTMAAEYTIAAKDYQLWSQNVKQLLEMNVRYLHLELTSAQNIMLSAKKYETSDIVDLACEQADDFEWSGVDVQAGEKWYRLNLAEVKAQNKKLNFVVANQGSQDATVEFDLSLDCPASVVFGYNWTIPAGDEMTEEFGRVFIDELKEDYVYLKLATDQALRLSVEEMPAPAPVVETWVVDDVLKEGQAYTISGGHIFEVPMATLSAPRGMKAEFVITNNTGVDAVLTKQISFANPVKTTIDKELPVAANATVVKEVVNNMAGVIHSQTAFIRFNATQELTVQLNYVVVNDEVANAKPVEIATCEKSQLLDWNATVKQSGLETKWYEIDLSTIKQNGEHLQLTFTNKSNNIVVVMGEILPSCASEDTIPYVCPVPAGKTINQVINYNLFALLPHPKHFYISATVIPTTATSIMEFKDVRSQADLMKFVPKDLSTIQEAEVELTANTISALVDPTACNQATTIARGVKYEQATGTTKWYRVTDELLNKLSISPDLAFMNNGKAAANITVAATVGCDYATFGMTTLTLPTWADLTVFPTNFIGLLLDKALNEDATEMYLQVTTDQPIAFGIDIDYGFGLGCDEAREFDWTKGAVIEKGDAQWLKFDISSVKKNKQQVRLTLTNESNSLAWVAMLTSLTCPFDVALPMVFPIPAGRSIDKVVDYSYFASTKLEELYVAVITEEKVSVKAQAEKATASPMDKLACENAVEVKSGELYENKGTQWYKFSSELFEEMSNLPRFSFATPEGQTNVTFGATVGCEYNIATRVTVPMPGNLDLSFRFPSFIFDVIRKFVHQDVTEVYLEMTTNKQLNWSIDMTYVDACESAIELDFSKPINLDLKANEDVWYKVDVNAIKALKDQNIKLAVYNNNDSQVDVEVEVSPTCPVIVSATETVSLAGNDSIVYTVPTSAVIEIHDRILNEYPILKTVNSNLIYYVRVRANGDLTIGTDTVTPPVTPEGCENATLLDWTKTINLSDLTTGWYKFDISSIHVDKKDFTLSLNNDLGEKKNVGFTLYKDCDTYLYGPLVVSFPVGITTQTIPYSMVTILGDIDMLYVYIEVDAKQACEDAILFDWNKGAYQKAMTTQWYEFDITPVLDQEKQVKLTFTNHSNVDAWVIAELALSCPYTVSIPIIVPVPANMNVDKWIDYSVFEASKLKHCYLGVTTMEADIELAATWEDARITPSEGCLNATKVETDVLYEHTAGTHWYKFTGDLFDKEGYFSRVRLVNRSAETVTITTGATVGCEYNIATRTSFKLPKRFDLAFAIPVWVIEQMKKFVDDDVKEFYLELTSDQNIAFSIGQDACETAIPFDWTTGHTQEALTTQWYEVDIASVLENEQQIKLTLTNHSNQPAWVATLVSLDCPFKVALPLVLPIPAGKSVDKVIDYSYFAATRLDHLYVGVTTDSKISVIAEAQSAIASATDKNACANATLLQSNEKYVHPAGTSWYKVDASLFTNLGRLPKFQFSTVSGETTKVTMGATVGCDYNIATKGSVNVPGGVDISLRIPTFIFKALKVLMNDDIDEWFVEITTDKDAELTINDANEDVDACLDAESLVISDSMLIDLTAQTDQWYKVDLSQIKEMNKDLAVTVLHAEESLDIEVEISPSCPVVASVLKKFNIPGNTVGSTSVTKVITAAEIADLLAEYPEMLYYVRIRATGNANIEVKEPVVVEPEACEKAINFNLCTPTVVTNTDVWFAIDLAQAKAAGKPLEINVKNIDSMDAEVKAELLYSCPGTVQESMTRTIGAGEILTYTMDSATLVSLADMLYMHIVTTGIIEVNVCEPTPPATPEACLDAIPYVLGQDIVLTGGDDKWYSIDVAAIRAMKEDMKVTVTNATDDTVKATLELAYECPVTMFETTITDKPIDPKTSFSEIIGIDVLEAHADVNVAYLHVMSTGDLTVNVAPDTTVVPVPEACELGDTIVWTSGMTLQIAEAVDKWYTVDISEASANKYDVKITVENNTGTDVNATIDVYTTCPVGSAVRSATQTIYSYSETTKKVMYDQYSKHNTDWLYIHLVTSGNLDISSEHIVYPKTYEYKTISEFVCDGTAFVDPITNNSVLISSLLADKFEWNDTVAASPTVDSVYTFVVTPVVAPVKMNDSILATISGAMPALKQGELPVVDASVVAIKAYYQGLDTEAISDVTTVTWKHAAGIIPCDATTYTMTLVVEDECDNVLETTFVFNVAARTVTETTTSATVCYGGSYHWDITGKDYLLAGEYRDTLRTANGCDQEIRILNLTVLPEIKTVLNDTICFGEMYKGTIYTASTTITETFATANGCDSTVIVNLTVLPDIVNAPVETATVCFGETYNWRGADRSASASDTLKNSLGCDSIIYTLNLTVLPAVVNAPVETATVCFGETYNWRGADRSASASDTLKNSLGCDSIIYTLNLTILPAVVNAPVETATVCFGETYNWRGAARSASASDTLKNSLGCDSIIYTLNLTVLPEAKVVTEEWQLCPGDLSTPRDWHGQSISAAGNYEAIEKFAGTDCDSVIYQLTVIIPDADNNATMDNLPAVSKYNNRILLLNINELKTMFDGWVPAEVDVQWFRVVGTQDAAYAAWNKLGDDEPLAKGHYYNLPDGGTLPAGQYYALVWRSSDVCEGGEIMRTVLITCGADASGPRLVPNVVRANETLTLENLNPSDVNEIRVYSSTGQLVATYTAEQVSKFIFNAATVSGYYMVDVENKNNKVTLRYVVK